MLQQMPKELLIEQVNNGLILMVLGMGVVFVFLTLLVFTTKLLSTLVIKFMPEQSVAQRPASATVSASSVTTSTDTEIAAAITAAVAHSKR
ncbi:MAG: OadG family protein [Sphaerochaetaceae bacterium]|jgi:oxaloacetate decarboxylase gamma subunit